jgi:hypothetical protein
VTDSGTERPFPERVGAAPVVRRARVLDWFRVELPLRLLDVPLERLVEREAPLAEREAPFVERDFDAPLVERDFDAPFAERSFDAPLLERGFVELDFEGLEDALPREDLAWAIFPLRSGVWFPRTLRRGD